MIMIVPSTIVSALLVVFFLGEHMCTKQVLYDSVLRALCGYLLLQLNPPNPASHFDAQDVPAATVGLCEESVNDDPHASRLQSLPPNPGMHLHVLPPHTPLLRQP